MLLVAERGEAVVISFVHLWPADLKPINWMLMGPDGPRSFMFPGLVAGADIFETRSTSHNLLSCFCAPTNRPKLVAFRGFLYENNLRPFS